MATKNRGFRALVGGALGDLDYFPVAGISDNDASFGIVNGLYHPYYYDSSLVIAANNSPYQIIPADNATGTGAWVLSGFQGALSHVRATEQAGQSIPNADAAGGSVIFGSQDEDTLNEYDNATGIFTAASAKHIQYNAGIKFVSAGWSAGEIIIPILEVSVGQDRYGLIKEIQISRTAIMAAGISCGVTLDAGETARFQLYQTQGAAVALSGEEVYNWLTIDEIQ